MTRRPCQCALAVFHKNVSNPTQNVEGVIKKGRCNIAAPFGTGGRFGMAAAYRVAAPSIRIVPWAALASCWPLPQQFLPVSATGGGRRCCTLAMFRGMAIFICSSETPAGVSELLFHGRSHSGERHLSQKPVNRFKVRTNSRHAKRGCCAVQQPLRVRL